METINKTNDYVAFFESLKINGNLNRLGKLFKTRENNYIYDTGTGKIFSCEQNMYDILENIFQNNGLESISNLEMDETDLFSCLDDLVHIISDQNLLKAPPLKEFCSDSADIEKIKKTINSDLEQISLELTEKCNLRCKYCVYLDEQEAYRNFEGKDMSWETAKKAIDFANKRSTKRLAVTFFGGEPLIQFDLLKKCVEYAKSIAGKKEVVHAITTNATLMTKEIAEYFASIDNFAVVCSLDGPQEIHDENRLTVDGLGSFKKTIRGLKYVVDAYKRNEKSMTDLSLNMVIAAPATPEKFRSIQSFFDSLDWIPKNMVKSISYVTNSVNRNERLSHAKGYGVHKKKSNPLSEWSHDNYVFNEKIDSKQIFTFGFMHGIYKRIHMRTHVEHPIESYPLAGCCTPGAVKLYVTVNGDFSLCERMGLSPYIGNVNTGVDFDAVKKHYVDDFIDISKKFCADCWAIRLCNTCYVDSYDEAGLREDFKKDRCKPALSEAENALIDYHEILERYPEKLEYLNDVEDM